jgi:hypothetical protein
VGAPPPDFAQDEKADSGSHSNGNAPRRTDPSPVIEELEQESKIHELGGTLVLFWITWPCRRLNKVLFVSETMGEDPSEVAAVP